MWLMIMLLSILTSYVVNAEMSEESKTVYYVGIFIVVIYNVTKVIATGVGVG